MKGRISPLLLLSTAMVLLFVGAVLVLPAQAGERALQDPLPADWVVAGNFQDEISSCGEWSNDCNETRMADADGDGVYKFVTDLIPAGGYEYKIVEFANWNNAYPVSNVGLSAPGGQVRFYFNPVTHAVADSVNQCIATVAGNFQHLLGGGDWTPDNLRTMLWQEAPGSDLYVFSTTLPAGNWEFKVARDEAWNVSYPANNVAFSLAEETQVNFEYNCATNAVSYAFGSGAGHDNNIFWDDLGYNSRDAQYRTPPGAVVTGTPVTVRLRAASGDLTGARVRVWDDYLDAQMMLDMTPVADDGTHEWWEATIPASSEPTIYWYRFIAVDGTATAYYEDDASRDMGWGQTFADSPDYSYQLTVYDPAFETPDWVKDAIIYQIFTDRFRDGDTSNDPSPGRFFYGELDGTIFRSRDDITAADQWQELEWNTAICDPRDAADCPGTYSLNFYGGDLQGVLDKLDYLQSIGVTALYFNPIFESPSNHKYDTTDFTQIAEDFGDEALFRALVAEAHARGMTVILDGVFNHTSSDSIYFDRYGNFDTVGACESEASPYRDWFYFTDVAAGSGDCVGSDGTPDGATYESWFGFDSLPKLNSTTQEVRDYFWDGGDGGIGTYWLAPSAAGEDDGADGWRLDVGGDVDPGRTNAPLNDYWEGFRAAVRGANPEAYIVIEEWGNASPWLLGGEMDATMNYQYSTAMLGFWRDSTFTDNDHNTGSSAGPIAPLTPAQLDNRLHNWIERYPPEALYAMMNLLGSHDTNRALFMLDHNAADSGDDSLLSNPDYDWSEAIERLKGVWLLQMTLPGAPTTYYGDEVALVGPTYVAGSRYEDDPYNRQPYPWLDEAASETPLGMPFYTFLQSEASQAALRDYYSTLTAARNSHEALRTGSFDTLLVDNANELYAYGRLLPDYSDAAVVILNRAGSLETPTPQAATVDVGGYLPVGATFVEVLTGDSYTVNASGELVVDVPGESGAVLVLDGMMDAPPAVVIDLTVDSTGDGEVNLSWSASTDADSYDVYRSLVSGGGYEFAGTTTSTNYVDSGLANAVAYYYVVVAVDDTTGLESGLSNEVMAIPQYDIESGWYNLQWPPSITHIISTMTPTADIYGQIWIGGVTDQPGQAPAIRAQVGYGPDGSQPGDPGWSWAEMTYNGDAGNNDEYRGNLLPDQLGSFIYVTRWSVDGGRTWYYGDLDGPDEPPVDNPGVLTVVASSDTTAPAAPTNLVLDGTTPSSILMSWDAVSAPDLAGYEVYRQQVVSPTIGLERVARLGNDVTSYADEDVETGATYRYYVVAFDTSFNRSEPSNEIEGTAEARFVEVTFRVRVPSYTPDSETVYLVGDIAALGPWNPGLVPMTQVDDDIWEYTLDILDGTNLQYKYTRGSWDTVESWGSIVNVNNRNVLIEHGDDGTMLVDNTGTDWGDANDNVDAVRYWRDPLVVDVYPEPGATQVPLRGTVISVTWSIPMAPGTSFEVTDPRGNPVDGTFAYDEATMTTTFTPTRPLAPVGLYTVTVSDQISVGVPNGDSGVQQVPFTWSFSTHPALAYWPVFFSR